MVDASDRLNLEAAAEGDREACETLLTLYGPIALGVCRRVLGAGEGADAAFQSVFAKFLKRGARSGRDVDPALWIHRAAYRVARRSRSQARAEADSRFRGRLDLRRMIDDDVDGLWRGRGPVILCGLMNLSPAEAAERLGLPVDQVERRLIRGLQTIDTRLRRHVERAAPGTIAPFLSWQELGDVPVPPSLREEVVQSAARLARGRRSTADEVDYLAAMNPPRLALTAFSRARRLATSGILVIGMGVGASYAALMAPETMETKADPLPVESVKPTATAGAPRLVAGTDAILARLNQPSLLKFPRPIPLDEFLARVRDQTQGVGGGLSIHVDLAGLKRAGASLSSPISVNVEGTTLAETLGLALDQAGLYYRISGNLVIVSAVEPAGRLSRGDSNPAAARSGPEERRGSGRIELAADDDPSD